jgi:hypothetical protein
MDASGDANTSFFHTCANDRRRKTRICSLETSDQSIIRAHIVEFYKKLFDAREHRGVSLGDNFWDQEERLEVGDKEMLVAPFSEKEVGAAVAGMKSNSTPRPNGFIVFFFKKLWGQIKGHLMTMVKTLMLIVWISKDRTMGLSPWCPNSGRQISLSNIDSYIY